MTLEQQFIQEIIIHIDQIISSKKDSIETRGLKSNAKADNSIVTEIDLLLSKKIQEIAQKFFPNLNYIDEEIDSIVSFPALVVDPIDGTKELNQGISECAVSIAYMNSSAIDDPKNFAVIYNPLNHFLLHSFQMQTHIGSSFARNLRVMISRTECNQMQLQSSSDVQYIPIGSIAYKLAMLAQGMFEAVISYREKNIWDIAAGCILLSKCGGKVFNSHKQQITKLDKILLDGPFIWVRDDEVIKRLKV
jgi:myo-inositol-1(or 4)-monophosphatase